MGYTNTEIAERIKPIAEKYEIPEVYLFGSYARERTSDHSDIDVLIKRNGSKIYSAFDLGGLLNELKEALGQDVDLVTIEALDVNSTRSGKRHFSQNLNNEKVLIYARP